MGSVAFVKRNRGAVVGGEQEAPRSASGVRQADKKGMLPTIRLHDLRHTHATLALQAGVHPKVVSERLGRRGQR